MNTDWRTQYPFASHWITLEGGHRLHYLDEGGGPVLLLLHGNPTWSFYWREIVKAFRGQYRLIVPDLIGCGLSDKPSPRRYSYHLQRRAEDINALVSKLKVEHVTLVAHDWGGAVGMAAAVQWPARFERFVLMNTAAFRGPCPWRIRLCHVPILGQLAVQGSNLFARVAVKRAVEKHERMTPVVREGLLAPYDSWQNRTGVYRFVRDIPMSPRHPTFATLQQTEAGLARFREYPVCLIWGMRDWCFTPWFLQRFTEIFPDADVHRFDDAGHYVVEDAWERIVPIMDQFLKSHPLAISV